MRHLHRRMRPPDGWPRSLDSESPPGVQIILSAFLGVCAAGALNSAYLPPNAAFRQAPAFAAQAPSFGAQSYQERPRASLERNAAILRSDSDVNEQGFHYAYETENGIQAEETGHEADGIQAQGGYSYTGDDGQVYSVRYSAGADGFQAEGSHLPTPPPVPELIAKALAENARDEAAGIFDDGSYNEGKYGDIAAGGVTVARTQQYNQQSTFNQPSRQYLAPKSGFRSQSGYHY
ncbi:Cuticle protein 3 [Eumeta japonica]|uniref:Cuticle protein 3 n=1 Tax=Eumeta variegata TaxID=151549 RepID=A0A4C1YS89_EUMVA|nr:Cuticle protein 3 [Eumeta japonica]